MQTKRLYEERVILHAIARSDGPAFRVLYDFYRDKIYYIAIQLLKDRIRAEDVVQEVFLKIWRYRETLTSLENFNAWLNTVTRNEVYNILRKIAAQEGLQEELYSHLSLKGASGPEDGLGYRDLEKALAAAMEELTPRQREVFRLSRLKGLKNREIEEALQMRPETVKKHLTDALRTVRSKLAGDKGISVLLLFLIKL